MYGQEVGTIKKFFEIVEVTFPLNLDVCIKTALISFIFLLSDTVYRFAKV
jgi:hypothetical protein